MIDTVATRVMRSLPEVQETLKGAMYWEHCLKLDNIELKNAELADKSN